MNMKSVVFALLLSYISMVMATDWVQVSKTNENGTRFYVDVDSINGDESLRKAWVLEDRKSSKTVKVNGKSIKYMSYKSLRVVYCDQLISSHQRGVFYSKNLGRGKDLYSYSMSFDDLEFTESVPQTMGVALNEFICSSDKQVKKYI